MTVTKRVLRNIAQWDAIFASFFGFALFSLASIICLFARDLFKNFEGFGVVVAWLFGISVASYFIGFGMRYFAGRLAK